jgi:RNA polymerase sigma factor (sigma-70 family)
MGDSLPRSCLRTSGSGSGPPRPCGTRTSPISSCCSCQRLEPHLRDWHERGGFGNSHPPGQIAPRDFMFERQGTVVATCGLPSGGVCHRGERRGYVPYPSQVIESMTEGELRRTPTAPLTVSDHNSWIVRIAINRAHSIGRREGRVLPLSSAEAAVDPSRFDTHGLWITPPEYFVEDAEDRVVAGLLLERIRSSLDNLPESQRQVVTLRDVEGLDSKEVCRLLEISEANQRVLLHRGRSRLRQDLETKFGRVQ